MASLEIELLWRLLLYELEVRPQGCFGNGLGIIVVILLPLRERFDVDRRDDPGLKAKGAQTPADKVGTEAGFHAHNAARQRLENRFERQSPELAAQDDFPAEIKSYDVKNVFPDIDADRLQRKLILRRLGSSISAAP